MTPLKTKQIRQRHCRTFQKVKWRSVYREEEHFDGNKDQQQCKFESSNPLPPHFFLLCPFFISSYPSHAFFGPAHFPFPFCSILCLDRQWGDKPVLGKWVGGSKKRKESGWRQKNVVGRAKVVGRERIRILKLTLLPTKKN